MRDSIQGHQREDVAVIGYAARLPGVDTIDDFWRSLIDGRCHVRGIPDSRWSSARFFDPDRDVQGKTYARSAGLIDNVYDFDAAYFGLSPREAEQMDPQQRVLLETVARAFDHAGVDPNRLDRKRTGVFIGASSSDHSTMGLKDPKMIDAQYMLGNTLSIISNRISYQWDLSGPSYTVDTACSSGLFALDQAVRAIRDGDIDTAVVGSVNMLLSPLPFIGFARASMLSQVGLCQAFGKNADGYVRGEGAVVFILRRADLARIEHDRIRSVVAATGTNSDGRTTGIAMPSSQRQSDLFENIKTTYDIDPNDLAFVEAHGTGTPVGDPEEAHAIGSAYGQHRSAPLPIGSAKTNFGHLEPAAGLVGLLKAQMSLEHGVYPPSLHADELNPHIPFDDLGLKVARESAEIPTRDTPWLGAVNSFGFGGANAHAILRQVPATLPASTATFPKALVLSAASETALKALATEWAQRSENPSEELAQSISDANLRLPRHQKRLVATAGSAEGLRESLTQWLSDETTPAVAAGTARMDGAPLGFVFSGNGSQWAGMGRHMLLADPVFRESYSACNSTSLEHGGPSLLELIMSVDLEEQLERAPVAQPLLLAIQIATVDALAAQGVKPGAVLGHSAGEVAAAYACGAITRTDAFRIILARSLTLDKLYGDGTMAALSCSVAQAEDIISTSNLSVDIAAENSAESITVSGPAGDISQFLKLCRKRRIAGRKLAIEYPYHSHQIDRLKAELLSELEGIGGTKTDIRFFSGSTGELLDGDALDNHFWWHNARDAVKFRAGVEAMAKSGVSVFLEISPKSVLRAYVRDTLEGASLPGFALGSLEQTDADNIDSFSIALKLLAHGVAIENPEITGDAVSYLGDLPAYPFDRKTYSLHSERERDLWGTHAHHPLLGSRVDPDATVWTSELSLGRLPWLADHKVGGRVLLPATAIVEMFLSAALDVRGTDKIDIRHVEILRPIQLQEGQTVPTRVTYESQASRLTLEALSGGEWNWIAGASVFDLEAEKPAVPALSTGRREPNLYSELSASGLEYGEAFARLTEMDMSDTSVDVQLGEPTLNIDGLNLDPTATDACLHGLLPFLKARGESSDDHLFVPGHIGSVKYYRQGDPVGARLTLVSGNKTGICVNVDFVDRNGDLIAEIKSLWLRPMPSGRKSAPFIWNEKAIPIEVSGSDVWRPDAALALAEGVEPSDLEVIRDAIGSRLAWDVVSAANDDEVFDARLEEAEAILDALGIKETDADGRSDPASCPWPELSELLKILVEIDPQAIDEIDATLHGTTSDQTSSTPGFSRMSGAMLDYLSNVPTESGRVLMAGHIDPVVLNALLEKADHVVLAVEKNEGVDALRIRFDQDLPVHIVPVEDALKLGGFDLVVGGALAQTTLASTQRQLARFVAQGNPAILFDYAVDTFELMTGRYSDANAVLELDDLFSAVGVPVERRNWRQDSGLTFAYVAASGEKEEDIPAVAALGETEFAKTLREFAKTPEDDAKIAVIALDAGEDTIATIMAQRDAFCDLPTRFETVWIAQAGLDAAGALGGIRRVLKNELGVDVRTMSVDAGVTPERVLEVAAKIQEHEVVLREEGAETTRIVPKPVRPAPIAANERLILSQPPSGRTEAIEWRKAPRTSPENDEIEIEVAATALNFRDVMFARGLLPPDILNGGYAGPTLGMECAGIVSKAGPDATFKTGDRVIAFSPNAFATHVTISSRTAIAAPTSLALEAAAAIPVIFVTAEYALTELARLRQGEWCLIHGGAGGVGLAAIQVARRAGAKVIATAGSEKKRALLRLLGVEHVCDSRSLEFVTDVTRITNGQGVDVILNSLAGRAMEQGLSCLAPFGRFIELGKRDFVANTSIGLRAMRNNISYFGVDADQLLKYRQDLGDRVMKTVAEGFQTRDYSVPPVRVFSSEQVIEAFRLMENSGHIGKVVVVPPKAVEATETASTDFSGSWLISGGTKGFGLETARMLASKGAERLWLVSRSGVLESDSFASEMEHLGVDVHVRAVDLTNAGAVKTLFNEIAEDSAGLSGVVCGAAVFDDANFNDMDAERFEKVVQAKLGSATLLDRASRRFDIRHFWLFSSVSCRFGNPGQSAYVTANMELEALARRRKAADLPALAIAWGPLGDAGYLSEAHDLKSVIERKLGTVMKASYALDQVFSLIEDGHDLPTVTIAPVDWSRLKPEFPLLSEPLFEYLHIRVSEVGQDGILDIHALIAEKGETKARKVLLDLICEEAAQVMRIAPSEIDVNRELTELGFDSLMGMNLKLAVEERLGTTTPISSVGDGMTLSRLSHLIVASVHTDGEVDETEAMAERHLTGTSIPSELKEEISNAATR